MTFAEGFFEYFKAYPLPEGRKLNFEYHGTDPGECFISTDAPDALQKRYASGNSVWQKPVYFCMVGSVGADARIQIENKVEFEQFRDWVEDMDARRQWPQLPANRHPISLRCVTDGYVIDEQENTAQYQIQMIFTYQRNARR